MRCVQCQKTERIHFFSFFFLPFSIFLCFSTIDAQAKLDALLQKLEELLPFATNGECSKVFGDLASFAQAASAVRSARELRRPLTLDSLLGLGEERSDAELVLQMKAPATQTFCSSCKKHYQRELQCDGCDCEFRWCCAGYDHQPCSNHFFFTGVCVTLPSYCRLCLTKLAISPEQVLEQEQDYLELGKYFSRPGCEWRWIPCFFDGYTVFSAAWVGLEGLRFMLSPFYCGIGTERDITDSRKDADFLDFVSKCASEALNIIALSPDIDQERKTWIRVRDYPELSPKLQGAQLDVAWSAVCRLLESEMALCVRIWKFVDGALSLGKTYESGRDCVAPKETIDILMWNTKVSTRIDLLLFKPSQDSEEMDFSILN